MDVVHLAIFERDAEPPGASEIERRFGGGAPRLRIVEEDEAELFRDVDVVAYLEGLLGRHHGAGPAAARTRQRLVITLDRAQGGVIQMVGSNF